jgi:hypothetical protein
VNLVLGEGGRLKSPTGTTLLKYNRTPSDLHNLVSKLFTLFARPYFDSIIASAEAPRPAIGAKLSRIEALLRTALFDIRMPNHRSAQKQL